MPTPNLYHSALKKMGPIRVTVQSDVLQSKFPGKPDYVCLRIGTEDFNYSLENPTCGDVFEGQKGNTFTIIADGGGKGKEDTATVTYVGEAADDGDTAPAAPAPARTAAAPARPAAAPARRGPVPHNTSVPPGHPARQAAPAAAAPTPAAQSRAQFVGHPGARVGACLNKAVDYLIAEGLASSDPAFSETLYNLVSDMVRVTAAIEEGHLAPKQSERK